MKHKSAKPKPAITSLADSLNGLADDFRALGLIGPAEDRYDLGSGAQLHIAQDDSSIRVRQLGGQVTISRAQALELMRVLNKRLVLDVLGDT